MNVINSYTEDYTKAYSSSFMHEPVGGWRLPKNLKNHLSQEEYLNTIKKSKNKSLINNSEYAFYKSANTDVPERLEYSVFVTSPCKACPNS